MAEHFGAGQRAMRVRSGRAVARRKERAVGRAGARWQRGVAWRSGLRPLLPLRPLGVGRAPEGARRGRGGCSAVPSAAGERWPGRLRAPRVARRACGVRGGRKLFSRREAVAAARVPGGYWGGGTEPSPGERCGGGARCWEEKSISESSQPPVGCLPPPPRLLPPVPAAVAVPPAGRPLAEPPRAPAAQRSAAQLPGAVVPGGNRKPFPRLHTNRKSPARPRTAELTAARLSGPSEGDGRRLRDRHWSFHLLH